MKRKRSHSLLQSFKYAFQGVWSLVKLERNYKIMLLGAVLASAMAMALRCSLVEWSVIALAVGACLAVESINTAVEVVVDFICPDDNQSAKLAKDISAAASLAVCLAAVVVGALIFLPKIAALL
ncbi:MAG: diacylglycerol kinase family protein [Eubacteriaceae bacterium]|nr:diacylglycerol kinase family protein [Eubacteriaceae bacterium]